MTDGDERQPSGQGVDRKILVSKQMLHKEKLSCSPTTLRFSKRESFDTIGYRRWEEMMGMYTKAKDGVDAWQNAPPPNLQVDG
jgi:hypothetical protein